MKNEATFGDWLEGPDIRRYPELQTYSAPQGWGVIAGLEDAWHLVDGDPNITAQQKDRLKIEVARAYAAFESGQKSRPVLFPSAFGLGVFLFMGATLSILFFALFESSPVFGDGWTASGVSPLLVRLSNVESARGLITFVFVIGVMALALIIVTANVVGDGNDSGRFERSKEILTTLIAILGTILGFYFGKADSTPAQPETAAISVGIGAEATGADPSAVVPD